MIFDNKLHFISCSESTVTLRQYGDYGIMVRENTNPRASVLRL